MVGSRKQISRGCFQLKNFGYAVHFGAFATYAASFEVPVFKDFILENIDESDFVGVDFPVIRSEKNYHQLTDTEKV